MAQQQKPKPAATVILLRSGGRDPFEIFLTRRPEDMAFLGGMYCFPGGTVRKEDCSRELLERTYGLHPKGSPDDDGLSFSPATSHRVLDRRCSRTLRGNRNSASDQCVRDRSEL